MIIVIVIVVVVIIMMMMIIIIIVIVFLITTIFHKRYHCGRYQLIITSNHPEDIECASLPPQELRCCRTPMNPIDVHPLSRARALTMLQMGCHCQHLSLQRRPRRSQGRSDWSGLVGTGFGHSRTFVDSVNRMVNWMTFIYFWWCLNEEVWFDDCMQWHEHISEPGNWETLWEELYTFTLPIVIPYRLRWPRVCLFCFLQKLKLFDTVWHWVPEARNALARHEAGQAAKGDGAWDSSLTLGIGSRALARFESTSRQMLLQHAATSIRLTLHRCTSALSWFGWFPYCCLLSWMRHQATCCRWTRNGMKYDATALKPTQPSSNGRSSVGQIVWCRSSPWCRCFPMKGGWHWSTMVAGRSAKAKRGHRSHKESAEDHEQRPATKPQRCTWEAVLYCTVIILVFNSGEWWGCWFAQTIYKYI